MRAGAESTKCLLSLLPFVCALWLAGCASSGTPPAAPSAPQAKASGAVQLLPGEELHQNPAVSLAEPGDEVSELGFAPGETTHILRAGLSNVAIGGKHYCLRTYNGQLPGPMIEVGPKGREDRTLSAVLINTFKMACKGKVGPGAENSLCRCTGDNCYDFNGTNLHTHGFHVRPDLSPDGKFLSDHVLMELTFDGAKAEHGGKPLPDEACSLTPLGYACRYLFDLDEGSRFVPGRDQHEPGTFWYHAHLHGATAMQLANGMAGELIVRGPVDKIPEIGDATEQVMVLQQIPLEKATEVRPDFVCDPTDPRHYSINTFGDVATARRTLINARLAPVIGMAPGEIQRWRLIHAGITQELKLELRGPVGRGACTRGSWPEEGLPLHEIAADGITLTHRRDQKTVRMDPGYRSDVMVEVPREARVGTDYCLIDAQGPSLQEVGEVEPANLVGVVRVFGERRAMKLPTSEQLQEVAKKPLDCDTELPVRKTVFNQVKEADQQTNCPPLNIDCKLFPDAKFALSLGAEETWDLTSEQGRHPFHIHVNPFTVCEEGGVQLEHPYWRDTLLLDPGKSYEIRSHYQGFTGAFVLHCHRLDHEDRGMMGLVTIK